MNFDTVKDAEIPTGYSWWSVSVDNDYAISQALNEILDECAANAGTYEKGTPEQKIADLYLSYVDEESRDAVGIEPIRPYLDAINSASTVQEYAEAIAAIDGEINYASLVSFSMAGDLYDSTKYVVQAYRADLGLEREYLVDESLSSYWEAYKTLVTKLFVLYA